MERLTIIGKRERDEVFTGQWACQLHQGYAGANVAVGIAYRDNKRSIAITFGQGVHPGGMVKNVRAWMV
jgi:hypothetical protein